MRYNMKRKGKIFTVRAMALLMAALMVGGAVLSVVIYLIH